MPGNDENNCVFNKRTIKVASLVLDVVLGPFGFIEGSSESLLLRGVVDDL